MEDTISSRIQSARLDERVTLSDISLYFESVKFAINTDGTFYWVAKYKGSYAIGSVYPMKYGNIVNSFRTLGGAKRNAVRRLDR